MSTVSRVIGLAMVACVFALAVSGREIVSRP